MSLTADIAPRPLSLWRDVICPKEHGSWSLAFEPLALALLVAPSVPGSWLAVSLAAAFFARRPLRAAVLERRLERRAAAWRALAWCAGAATGALGLAVVTGGTSWLIWLVPALIAGAGFGYCDARGEGREEVAELLGATAFALTPIAVGVVGGLEPAAAVALGVLMAARSAPSVATVRAFLRAAKTGVRRDGVALVAVSGALVAAVVLTTRGLAPWFAVIAMAIFAVRSVALLVVFRPAWRAKTLGMIETGLGLAFVAGLAATWA